MGQYNVVAPCTVDGKSYVNPTVQPIKVGDDKAKSLVEAGCLEPYPPGPGDGRTVVAAEETVEPAEEGVYVASSLEVGFAEPDPATDEQPESKPRKSRRTTED